MGLFASRKAIPLEFQRGGTPMVIDGRAPMSAYRDGQPGVMDSSFEYAPTAQKASIIAGAFARAREQAGQFSGNGGWTGYSMGQSDPYAQSTPNYGPAPGGTPYQQRADMFPAKGNVWDTPGYGDGTQQGGAVLQDTPVLGGMVQRDPMAAAPMPEKHKVNWAGVIADTLAGLAGHQGPYAARMAQQRQQDREEVIWNRRQQAQQQQAIALLDYKRAHPDDDFTGFMTAAGIVPGSDEAKSLYRQRAQSMAAGPLMAVDGFDPSGNPTKTFLPRTFGTAPPAGPTGGAPTPGMVQGGYRFKGGDPASPMSWEAVGGAAPTANSPFPTR